MTLEILFHVNRNLSKPSQSKLEADIGIIVLCLRKSTVQYTSAHVTGVHRFVNIEVQLLAMIEIRTQSLGPSSYF